MIGPRPWSINLLMINLKPYSHYSSIIINRWKLERFYSLINWLTKCNISWPTSPPSHNISLLLNQGANKISKLTSIILHLMITVGLINKSSNVNTALDSSFESDSENLTFESLDKIFQCDHSNEANEEYFPFVLFVLGYLENWFFRIFLVFKLSFESCLMCLVSWLMNLIWFYDG